MARPRRNDFLIPTIALITDAIAIEISFLLSFWLRFRTDILNFLPLTEDQPPLEGYVYGSFFVIPVWLIIFHSRKMYGARRNIAPVDEFFNVVRVVTLGMLVVMSAAFFYRAFSYSRVVFGLLWITGIIIIFIGRIFVLYVEKKLYEHGRELRNAAIIGSNKIAERIYHTLRNHPLLGYKIVGFFSDHRIDKSSALLELKYLGTFDDAPEILIKERIELALVSLNIDEHPRLYKLLQQCEGYNIEFMMVPDVLEIMTGGMKVKEIEGIPFIKLKHLPITTWGRIIKRIFDILISGVLIIILSPLFLLISILIKIESKGPVLFKQTRVGVDGKEFQMLKFRSMVMGADKYDEQAGLGVPDDPRRTRIGRILRKTGFDELPQLFNVFRGDMSLVGPRPERPYFVDQYKTVIPKYLDRHRVKTGITGWAQVNGLRGNTSLEERIRYDVYYIENWSMAFDIRILIKTIGTLFGKKHQINKSGSN
ncbi:TPA: undecaprenyl-phosphate glucose phosphotransferase [bacterium]|nr:undecaprenyl-phosphate glucose phosphotransferase [bacterium]